MNKETDDARWQGIIDTTIKNLIGRLARLERFIAALVLGLAALYLRAIGILP